MPLYEYDCPDCGATFEQLVPTAREADAAACPSCGRRHVRRRFSVFAAHGGERRESDGPRGCGRCGDPEGPCAFQ